MEQTRDVQMPFTFAAAKNFAGRCQTGPPGPIAKGLLNAGAFMMTAGRVLPSVRHKRAYRAHEPDIDRTAERLSRAASAAIAGVADAGVRARHRAWSRRQ